MWSTLYRFRVSHSCSVGSIAGTVLASAGPWLSLTTCILHTSVLFTLQAALWGENSQQLYFNEIIIISEGGEERLAKWRRFTQQVPVVEEGWNPGCQVPRPVFLTLCCPAGNGDRQSRPLRSDSAPFRRPPLPCSPQRGSNFCRSKDRDPFSFEVFSQSRVTISTGREIPTRARLAPKPGLFSCELLCRTQSYFGPFSKWLAMIFYSFLKWILGVSCKSFPFSCWARVFWGHLSGYFGCSEDGVSAEMGHESQPGKNLKVLHPPQSIMKEQEPRQSGTCFPQKLKWIHFQIPCFCSCKTVALKDLIVLLFYQSAVVFNIFGLIFGNPLSNEDGQIYFMELQKYIKTSN